MNKQIKSKMLVLITFCSITVSTQPLSESTAQYGAIAGGVAAGTATSLITYYGFLKKSNIDTAWKTLLTILPAAGVGGLTWWLLDKYLYSLTPRGKCLAAEKIMRWIETDSLIANNFESVETFVDHINIKFGTSWPLVLTRNHLMLISTNLSQLQSLIQSIQSEAQGKYEYADIIAKCNLIEPKLQPISLKIEHYMRHLIQNTDYSFQVKLHEQYLEEQRKREHEQHLKQRELSHDSWEKTQDRWEKDKDRQLKKELVQGNNRPVMVSI